MENERQRVGDRPLNNTHAGAILIELRIHLSCRDQTNQAENRVSVKHAFKAGRNQLGRTYSPGLPLSMADRQHIVQLYQVHFFSTCLQ